MAALVVALLLCLPSDGSAWPFGKTKSAEPPKAPVPVEPIVRNIGVVYQAIMEVGPYEQLLAKAGGDTHVIKSSDGRTGYLVRKTTVESREQLIRIMGAESVDTLADGQKGLLGVYDYAKNERIKNFLQLLPVASGTVKLELTDTTGFEDKTRFPTVQSDFWPRNAQQGWHLDGKLTAVDINIQMSPVDASAYGQDAKAQMESTFVHEFAHSFDLGHGEVGGYGPDGAHHINERIAERAAFIESFAVFHQLIVDPSLIPTYRWNLRNIKYEGPEGYRDVKATDDAVSSQDILNVEGIQALILYRFSQEVPDGRNRIYEAFKKVNTTDKTFKLFMLEFVRQNPDSAETIARILDQETRRKMSNDELRSYLGTSDSIEGYLENRRDRIARGLSNNATDSRDVGYDPYASSAPNALKPLPKLLKKPIRFLESIREQIIRPVEKVREKVKTTHSGSNPFSDD